MCTVMFRSSSLQTEEKCNAHSLKKGEISKEAKHATIE